MVRIGVSLVHSSSKTNASLAVLVGGRNYILGNVLGTVIRLTLKMVETEWHSDAMF